LVSYDVVDMAEVKDIRVTVAPFYDTTASIFANMSEEERLSIRENFFHNAAFLADICALSFNSDVEAQNIGGFLNELHVVSHRYNATKCRKTC